jgi:ATP-binding cassette subfamily B protein
VKRSNRPLGGPAGGSAQRHDDVRAACRRALARALASLRPEPDDAALVGHAPGMSVVAVVRRFWPLLRPLRGWLLLGLLLLAAAPAIEVVEVLLFQRVVDDVLVPADFGPLVWIAAAYVGLNLLSAVVTGADDYLSTWVSQRFLVRLRSDTFRHVLTLPLHVHERRHLGDVLSRITADVAAVERFMVGQLTDGISSVVRLVFFVVALFWLQWELALASLIVVPLFWWVSTRFAQFVKDVSREKHRRSGTLGAVAEENLANAPLVQAYNRQDDAVAKFHRENTAIASSELAASRVRAVFLPVVDLAELVGVLVVVGMGVWALATDRLTLGGLLAFLTLLAQCYRPVRDLADLIPSMYSATAGIERLCELLDEQPPARRRGAVDLPRPSGDLELDSVTARYPGAAGDAVSDLSLRVHPGEVVAVVGPSGSGKSTLVRLLTGTLDASGGEVRIDGHDVRDVTLDSLRAAVGVVLQETLMLDASVHDNIAFARPSASRSEVQAAARAAQADGFVAALPQGYDTRVGQRGRSLSGGQRQRISLARELLRDSPILVLDEPTTGLDAADSRAVLRPLLTAAQARTIVVMTHDPVVLEFADRVVHLESGRLLDGHRDAGRGSAEELQATGREARR